MPDQSVSEDRNDSDNESEDVKTPRKRNKVSSTKKESAEKSKKIITVERKPRSAPKRISKKPLATHESDDDSEESPKVSSRKKKNEEQGKQKTSTVTKFSSSKEKTGRYLELYIPAYTFSVLVSSEKISFLAPESYNVRSQHL